MIDCAILRGRKLRNEGAALIGYVCLREKEETYGQMNTVLIGNTVASSIRERRWSFCEAAE